MAIAKTDIMQEIEDDMMTLSAADMFSGIAGGSSIVSTTPYDTPQIQLPPTADDIMRWQSVLDGLLFASVNMDHDRITEMSQLTNLEDRLKSDLMKEMLSRIKTKTKFTKIEDPARQNTSYRAKVYVFSESELRSLIENIKSA